MVVVLGSLLALGVWGVLARPSTPAVREPGPPALTGSPSGPGPSADGPATATEAAPGSGPRVDWGAVRYPLDCQGLRVLVVQVVAMPRPGRSRPLDLVQVRCDAGAGSPPSEVLGYDPPASRGGTPRLVGELLKVSDDVLVTSVDVHGATVVVAGTTYASATVPRCCPDRTFRATWTWTGASFEPSR